MLDLTFTAALTALLIAGGVVAIALLPWTDAEVEATYRAFARLWARVRGG